MHVPAPPGYEAVAPRLWPIPPMDHASGAKASAYTPELGRLVLARILAGETVRQVTADPAMPSYATVYHWTRRHEVFGEGWRMVRDALAQRALDRARQARVGRASQRLFDEERGVRPRRGPGRATTYTVARGRKVCRRIAAGWSMSQVVREPGQPSAKAVYRWLRTQPTFRRAYVLACEARRRLLEVEMMIVADGATPVNFIESKRAVARLEGRIGRLTPKRYRVLD